MNVSANEKSLEAEEQALSLTIDNQNIGENENEG